MHSLKLFLLSFSFLFVVTAASAQDRIVKGQAKDTSSTPIYKATVQLFYPSGTDTLKTITNNVGSFSFQGVKAGPFVIKISNSGFLPFQKKIDNSEMIIDAGELRLTPSYTYMEEIVISSPPIVMKEDTVEFKADSFKVKPNALVEDLLKKLPGVAVDKDGNVTAGGKQVTKVRVNGKDFFQGDVKTATRELTADMIDKVQVVDDYGDMSSVSGIKDGEPDKVINLQLKKDKNKGTFGRLTVGEGDHEHYQASLSANYFNNNNQFSVFSNSNNVNASLFNTGGGGGGGQNRGGGGGGGGGFVMMGGNNQNSNSGGGDGISATNSIGTNFRSDFTGDKKGSFYGSYSFTRRMTDVITDVSQQNLFASGTITNNKYSKSYNQSNRHNSYLNFEYNIDSFNYVKISPQISYSESINETASSFEYLKDKLITTSKGINQDSSLSHSPNINVNAIYNHKFQKRGRNLSVNMYLNTATTLSDQYTNNFNNNLLPVSTTLLIKQLIGQNNLNNGAFIRFNYSEPIAKDKFVDLIYSVNKSFTRNDRKNSDLATSLPVINQLLSNAYENDYLTQRIGANLRTVKKKYNYSLGVSFQPVTLNGYSITKDSSYMPQNRVNVFPVARLAYNFTRTKTLNFNYQGNASQPSFAQMQPVRDISNPQYQTQGNPFLKPSQSHNFTLYFNNFNFSSGKVMFMGLNANMIQNQIVNNTIRLGTNGAQLTIPQNVNGYYNLTGFYNWSKPIQNRTHVFSLNGSANYNHNIALIDSAKNIGKNVIFSQGFTYEFNYKSWLEFNVGPRYNVNSSKYTLASSTNQSYNSWVLASDARVDFPKGIIFRYDVQRTLNNGLASGVNSNITLLNSSLEKTIFKKKNGFIKLSGFDILNQNKSITRQVTGSNITDTRTNRLTRYFMLTFTYRFNRFNGQATQSNQSQGDYRSRRMD
jgi:hypothetical protein